MQIDKYSDNSNPSLRNGDNDLMKTGIMLFYTCLSVCHYFQNMALKPAITHLLGKNVIKPTIMGMCNSYVFMCV